MISMDLSPFMAKYSAFSPYRLMRRETGFSTPIGAGDALARSLYCGMKPIASWDSEQANTYPTGGVFNLEFSPEGSLLVAACEKKSIQIFDPLTHQKIHSVLEAHSDCVNCVKFLDARMFATCSDDTTIAIWDVRHLKKKIRSLLGHSNWVKNIEFSVKDKLLVTSGLDGSIYTWDINSYTEYNLVYQRVFHASGLMRCRLSPDARQMVMCTTGGLLVIIHDLNLSSLALDLHGFKPNLYRLMQMSQQLIPIAAMYEHLFDSKRTENRVEFVSDFPEGNDAEVVSALQIHPQGWSALSRNISHDDRSEWSCIHDIQAGEPPSSKSCRDTTKRRRSPARRAPRRRARPYWSSSAGGAASSSSAPTSTATSASVAASAASTSPPPPPPVDEGPSTSSSRRVSTRSQTASAAVGEGAGPAGEGEGEGAAAGGGGPTSPPAPQRHAHGLSSIQNDVWEASITIKQHRMLQEMYSRGQVGRNFNMQRIMGINTGIAPPAGGGGGGGRGRAVRPPRLLPRHLPHTYHGPHSTNSPSSSSSSSTGESSRAASSSHSADEEMPHYIRQNRNRLLYYIEETNEGKGFIKELCYSADGRLVCSPFGRGMRLLALNPDCSELSQCVQDFSGPRPMVEVGQSLGIHQDLVVSSKFSPRHHLLVTGCLEGKVVWYEPCSGETLY